MALCAIFSGSQQILEEVCEHCGEKIRDIHISEIAVKAPNDPRTIDVKDELNRNIRVKNIDEKITELSASFIRRGLLDDAEAAQAKIDKKLKYGVRAEAMCSESIDIDARVTRSFCYRVEENPDDVRFQKVVGGLTLSASLSRAEKSDTTGSRMGVDRKGNVIKMNRFKNLRMDKKPGEEEIEKDDQGREIERKKGAFETPWFEALDDRSKERVIRATQECEGMIRRYGEEVKTMKVVARARNLADYDINFIRANGCRL